MSHTTRKLRMRALAAATALAFAATPAFAGQFATSGLEDGQQYDRFIVKLRDATAGGQKAATTGRIEDVLAGAGQAVQALRLQKGPSSKSSSPLVASLLRPMSAGADVVATSEKLERAEAEALMRGIAAHPDVEFVQVDGLMQPDFVPNDTYYPLQWGFNDADAGIRADQAWDIANGTGIIVAVIDTGITVHSDLNGNQVAGYDFIFDPAVSVDGDGRDPDPNDPGDVYTRPSSWHGTHVAGTVAAVTNNAKGVSGTAWGARFMPVRVLGRGGGYTSDIADAITWASGGAVPGVPSLPLANVADVLNLSLGGNRTCDPLSQLVINGAVSRGTTVVVSAGNDNFDTANKSPASCDNVVNVASVTSLSARSSFSNFGAKIDVAAPGSTIASTLNAGIYGPTTEAYAYYSGTSMAAPHVAGAIALAQSRRLTLGLPLWTPSEVEARLKATAYPLLTPCPEGCGAGIIDAHALVLDAGGGPLRAELSAYPERPATVTYGREVTFGVQVRSRGPEIAPAAHLDLSITNRVSTVEPLAPAGWSCAEVAPGRTVRNFRCDYTDGAYAADSADLIRFKVRVVRSTQVSVEATVSSDALDIRPSNNKATMNFTVGTGT